MSGLRAAVGLLTRVPARPGPETEKALPWLPIVGALIGAAVAAMYVLLRDAITPLAAAGVAVGAGALLTGGLHEDGLADVADAFGADVPRERRLEILKDPRHGTFGVLALIIDVVVRIGAVAALDGGAALVALPAAHAISRAAPALLMWLLPTATPAGMGATYSRPVTARPAVIALLTGMLIVAGLLGFWALIAGGVTAFVAAGMGSLSLRKIGGITGDVLGSTQQLTEIGVLLVCVAAGPGIPWWRA